MQTYEQAENKLKDLLNCTYSDNLGNDFIQVVKDLKYNFGVSVSVKFLKGLVAGDRKKKTQRVKYLLKSSGIQTKEEIRYYTKDAFRVRTKEIISYRHTNEPIKKPFPSYAFNEDMSLKSFVNVTEVLEFENQKTNGIKKRISKLKDKKNRVITGEEALGLYNAVNSSGVIQDGESRFIKVGEGSLMQDMEIVRILQI